MLLLPVQSQQNHVDKEQAHTLKSTLHNYSEADIEHTR